MASLKRQVMTGGLAETGDLDTLSQRQQIEIICSNNDIKIQACVWAQEKAVKCWA